MRIAYYTETYLPNMDGVVKSIMQSRDELQRIGDEVFIFTCGTKQLMLTNNDPHIYYYDSIPFNPYPSYRFAINPYPSSAVIDSKKIEVVHSHGMGTMGIAAMRIARKRKLPLIGSFHTLVQYATHYLSNRKSVQDLASKIAWKYLRWYYNKCDVTIVPSYTIKNLLEENRFSNVRVVPNGINISTFTRSERRRQEFGLDEEDAVFLFVGRLVMEKNLSVLIKASKKICAEIPNAKFVIAGTGPAEQFYKRLVQEHKVDGKFKFVGFVPEHKMASLYKSADVFVFPSKFETQGLSGIEAMACGLPVCAADYLALKEIVKPAENGYLFNPDSPDDLAENAIRTYEERNRLSSSAVKTAQKFSIDKTTAQLREVYVELTEK